MTTIDGSVSIRAHVPGKGDYRYTRYPDGTEELYDISRDPNEHVNRVNFDTGKGKTTADDAMRTLMSGLMDGQLAQQGYLISDGTRALTGTAADEMLVTTVGPGINSLAGRGGDDTYLLYRNATITEAAGGGNDLRGDPKRGAGVELRPAAPGRDGEGEPQLHRQRCRQPHHRWRPGERPERGGRERHAARPQRQRHPPGRHRQRRAARLVRPGSPYGRARERHARRRRRLRRLRLHRADRLGADRARRHPRLRRPRRGGGRQDRPVGDRRQRPARRQPGLRLRRHHDRARAAGRTTAATPRCSPTPTRTPPPRCGSWCGTARRRPPPTPRPTSRCETSDSASPASVPRDRRARR